MFAFLAGLALAVQTPASTPVEPVIPTTASEHVITVAGKKVPFRAVFAEHVLKDTAGKPQATISYTAYVRSDVRNRQDRPVMFVFNGGPGASSSPLHFSGIGPRLIQKAADGSRTIIDNPSSPIDTADLVFIDPVGTGFSRELPGGSGQPYWSVGGDASAVLGLIRHWIKENKRQKAPIFVAGESYGGTRVARIAHDATDLNIAGLLLVSPSLEIYDPSSKRSPDNGYVASLPTMAVAATRNGKGVDGNVEAVFAEAKRFALGDYAAALTAGDALDPAEKNRIAGEMARLTGLPRDMIVEAGLRIDAEKFRNTLLKDEHKVIGRLDTRVTAPIPTDAPKGRPSAANDPALGLGKSNVITSPVIGDYLRDRLGVKTQRDYVSLTLDVNFKWDWKGAASDPGSADLAGNIATLMKKRPNMRVMVIAGHYDLAVPILAPQLALERAGVPEDRLDMVTLEEGHSVFDSDAARVTLRPQLENLLATR